MGNYLDMSDRSLVTQSIAVVFNQVRPLFTRPIVPQVTSRDD